MRVDQAVGPGGGEWGGCSGLGVEDLLGLFVGKFKLRAVILGKLHVTAHG